MSTALVGISSMAMRDVLAELVGAYSLASGCSVTLQSVAGVDAARRVLAGEAFDVVILASDAIDRLMVAGKLVAGSRVDLVHSPVAIAVRTGAARPDVATDSALREAVLSARSVGYSTGPSGTRLVELFERWGIAAQIADRLVKAPPGVPVGELVASGAVELGFQQLSELMHLDGVDVLGTLPPGAQFITTFAAGVCATSSQAAAVRDLLAFMTAPAASETKRRHGMEPASTPPQPTGDSA